MKKISLIAAHGKNLEIGKDNKLLWNLPDDLARFKKLTQGHVVIMGSKTFESIGRPLPNRTNVIITKNKNYKAEGCTIVHTIDDAIEAARGEPSAEGSPLAKEIFIIGGGLIYKQFLPLADKLYITAVNKEYDADTFFPKYDNLFTKIAFQEEHEDNGLKYTFLELEK